MQSHFKAVMLKKRYWFEICNQLQWRLQENFTSVCEWQVIEKPGNGSGRESDDINLRGLLREACWPHKFPYQVFKKKISISSTAVRSEEIPLTSAACKYHSWRSYLQVLEPFRTLWWYYLNFITSIVLAIALQINNSSTYVWLGNDKGYVSSMHDWFTPCPM